MTAAKTPAPSPPSRLTVLLVDDQAIVGEAVRRMLANEPDIDFHYIADPTRAIEKAVAIRPTVILQDLVMPEVDGLTLVKFFRAHPATRDVPMIVLSSKEEPVVKVQAFALGANDYLVKLPDKLELIARVRYHSKGYIAQLERNEAYRRLEESQKLLADEMAQAAQYVASLLPPPLISGPVLCDWRFIPSISLGGDAFGYHWLDEDHMAIFLLDVCGHGVGAALLSVSVMNVLRAQSLPQTDFHDPAAVLATLNKAFPMERHGDKYFTLWYGVYVKSRRIIRYSGAGHPPPVLFTGPDPATAEVVELNCSGMAVGMWEEAEFENAEVPINPSGRLFVYSDGVVEIHKTNGKVASNSEFLEFMRSLSADEPAPMDRLIEHTRQMQGGDAYAADFSLVQLTFP